MIVTEFKETCSTYTNFEVWEVENIDAFFRGNEVLATIFQDMYKMSLEEFTIRREEIEENDYEIITKLLKEVGDKYFYIFTLHDKNHLELIGMQNQKIMNFGVDIEKIKHDHVYVLIMDKGTTKAFNFA